MKIRHTKIISRLPGTFDSFSKYDAKIMAK